MLPHKPGCQWSQATEEINFFHRNKFEKITQKVTLSWSLTCLGTFR